MSVGLTSAAVAMGAAEVLARITRVDTHLTIWRRERPSGLDWIDALDWDRLDDLDFPVVVDELAAEVENGLAEAGYPDDRRGGLHDYIVELATRFAAAMECDRVKVRLEVIDTDACQKLHADLVTARLLTTLHGPGTQWVEAAAPDSIRQLGPGDVAIFKGRRWVEEPVVLHRSPPIVGTSDTRLLLAIDPLGPAPIAGFDR